MGTHSLNVHAPQQLRRWRLQGAMWLKQHLLLMPEAAALLILLIFHLGLGAPPMLALIGLGVAGYFGARVTLLLLGRRAFDAAAYRHAERLTDAALALHPVSPDALALRGSVALAQRQTQSACAYLERAVRICPDHAALLTLLSAAQREANCPNEAHATAVRALACDPTWVPAYVQQALASERLGSSSSDRETLLRTGLALPAAPADEAALRCALAALLFSEQRVAEAGLTLAAVPGLLPACTRAQRTALHATLGQLAAANGNPDAAQVHFAACAELDPQTYAA